MPEDIATALARFQAFLDRMERDDVVDAETGFSAGDGRLLAAELEMMEQGRTMSGESADG